MSRESFVFMATIDTLCCRIVGQRRTHLDSRLLQSAAARAGSYLERIRDRRVFPDSSSVDAMSRLGGEMPIEGERPHDVLALLDDFGSPATVATTGGRYFGFVNGG